MARLHSINMQFRRSHRPIQDVGLEVFPEGHEYLDDIVISALIIERIRLVKRPFPFKGVKDMLNWYPGQLQ